MKVENKGKAKVLVLDSTYIKLNKFAVSLMRDELSYTAVYYIKQNGRKVRKTYQKSLISSSGVVYLGFYPRIKKFCFENDIVLELADEYRLTGCSGDGKIKNLLIPGITFRKDQKKLIKSSLKKERGVLKSPTGTGKTVMLMGLVSCYPKKYKWLIFVPNISILTQTQKEFEKNGIVNVITIGGKTGHKKYSIEELTQASVIITTSASFLNLLNHRDGDTWHDCIDAVVIDECHIGMKPEGRFTKIFEILDVPIRIGLTATLPNDEDALLCLEGLIGPVIVEMQLNKAAELKLLAKPKLKMLPVPIQDNLKQVKTYQEVVNRCLVCNEERNRIIGNTVYQLIKRGLSVIIFVTKIEHGELLSELLRNGGIENIFIQGATEGTEREEIKQKMIAKQAQCAIATVVWREGVNIPTLDAAILAGGGKTTSGTLQAIGRVLRRTEEKKKALVFDFLDPYRFLAEHTVERMMIYVEQGWI